MTTTTTTTNRTVEELCQEIGYTPEASFWDKPEKVQRSMIAAKKLEYARRAAVRELGDFLSAPEFSALPENIQSALRTVAEKRTGGGNLGGGARNVFMETLRERLQNVGDSVDELELFRVLKMGRGEVRAKIRENLKKAQPKDRFWVELDEQAEAWVLIGTGRKQPKGWTGAPIDGPATPVAPVDPAAPAAE